MDKRALLQTVNNVLEKTYGTPDLGNKQDPLDELMFIALSIRTKLENAQRAYDRLRESFPSWTQVLGATENAVAECVQVTGDAEEIGKAEKIMRILEAIQDKVGELDLSWLKKMSDEEAYQWLNSLPYVGPKTAHCVMLFSLDRNVLPVDSHIHRILKRLNLVSLESNAEATSSQEIQPYIPENSARTLHVNLLVHGRSKCKESNPECDECDIEALCAYAGHHVLDAQSRWKETEPVALAT